MQLPCLLHSFLTGSICQILFLSSEHRSIHPYLLPSAILCALFFFNQLLTTVPRLHGGLWYPVMLGYFCLHQVLVAGVMFIIYNLFPLICSHVLPAAIMFVIFNMFPAYQLVVTFNKDPSFTSKFIWVIIFSRPFLF